MIIQAYADESLQFDLRSLLSDEGTGILIWKSDSDIPPWMKIDSKLNLASGKPTVAQIGIARFQLTVSDPNSRNVAAVTVKISARPKWKVDTPFVLDAIDEDIPYNQNLQRFVVVPGGGDFIISSDNLPSWMHLNPKGTISGTPERKDVGDLKFELVATTRIKPESSKVTVHLKVNKVLHPIKWKESFSQTLQSVEDQKFSQAISGEVENFEGTKLIFELKKPHPWLQITAEGVLYGKPDLAHVGTSIAEVQANTTFANGSKSSASKMIAVNVKGLDHPPKWKLPTILLPNANAGSEYSQFLKSSVEGSEKNEPLMFSMSPKTEWASIDAKTGEFKMKPPINEAGLKTWVIKVTNKANLSAEIEAKVSIVRPPTPPRWSSHPILLERSATEEHFFSLELSTLVKNPSKLKLQFEKIVGTETKDWTDLTDGILSGSPERVHFPKTVITLRVKSDFGADQTELTIPINKFNHFPEWTLSPVKLKVGQGRALDALISTWVNDSDEDAITFSIKKIEGPSWVHLSDDNKKLVGKSEPTETQPSKVFVRADDGNGGVSECLFEVSLVPMGPIPPEEKPPAKTIEISSKPKPVSTDRIFLLPLKECAEETHTQIIWLLDDTLLSEPLLNEVKASITDFYKLLENPKITSSNWVADTNANLRGKPDTQFIGSDAKELSGKFFERSSKKFQAANSPVWTLFQLFSANSSEFIGKPFIRAQTPIEVITITLARDQHPLISNEVAKKEFTNDQYFNSFIKTSKAWKMPFRFHTLTRQCPILDFLIETQAKLSPENTYLELSKLTRGKYLNDCNEKPVDKLLKIAEAIKNRACLFSQQYISVSEKPTVVRLGKKDLDPEKWKYDLATKTVSLLWSEIDTTSVED